MAVILSLTDKEQRLLADFARNFLAPNEDAWIVRFRTLASANFKIPKSQKQLVNMQDQFVPEIVKRLKEMDYPPLYKKFFSWGTQMALAEEPYETALGLIGMQMVSLLSLISEIAPQSWNTAMKGGKAAAESDLPVILAGYAKLQQNFRNTFLDRYFELFNAKADEQKASLKTSLAKSESRRAREGLIRQILERTSQSLDLKEIFQTFSAGIRETGGYDHISIALCDEPGDTVTIRMISSKERSQLGPGADVTRACTIPRALHNRQTQIAEDIRGHKDCPSCSVLCKEGLRSIAIVPLMAGKTTLGTLNVASCHVGFFSREDRRFLEEIAGGLANAVKNARAHTALAQNLHYEQCAARVISRIHSTLDVGQILDTACREVTACCGADRTGFAELIEPEGIVRVDHEYRNPESRLPGLMEAKGVYKAADFQKIVDVLRGGQIVAVNVEGNVHPIVRPSAEIFRSLQIKTICLVPVFVFQKGWGSLDIAHCADTYVWTKPQLDSLKKIAKELSRALEAALTYQREKESVVRLEKQLQESKR